MLHENSHATAGRAMLWAAVVLIALSGWMAAGWDRATADAADPIDISKLPPAQPNPVGQPHHPPAQPSYQQVLAQQLAALDEFVSSTKECVIHVGTDDPFELKNARVKGVQEVAGIPFIRITTKDEDVLVNPSKVVAFEAKD